MAPRLWSLFAVRPLGPVLVLAPFLFLATGPGCSHRRATLRPIYAAPATVAPATVVPADPCPPAAVTPGFEAGGASVSGARLAPLPGSPAQSNGGGEPALEPVTPSRA